MAEPIPRLQMSGDDALTLDEGRALSAAANFLPATTNAHVRTLVEAAQEKLRRGVEAAKAKDTRDASELRFENDQRQAGASPGTFPSADEVAADQADRAKEHADG
jgi:hypothetical protein